MELLEFHCDRILTEIKWTGEAEVSDLNLDRFLAASLLQKSIRRGRTRWALVAAKRLYDIDPSRLWRRLIITLFEDIGVLDHTLPWDVLGSWRLSKKTQNDLSWKLISHVVENMCSVAKTQSANNTVHLALYDQQALAATNDLFDWTVEDCRIWLDSGTNSIVHCLRGMWILSGMKMWGMETPQFHPDASMLALGPSIHKLVPYEDLRELLRIGLSAGGSILALAATLIASQAREKDFSTHLTSDYMPPERLITEVPSWIFDQYTKSGKRALKRAATECPNVASVLNALHVSATHRASILGSIHFDLESVAIYRRLTNSYLTGLEQAAHEKGKYFDGDIFSEVTYSIRTDWNIFLQLRTEEVVRLT